MSNRCYRSYLSLANDSGETHSYSTPAKEKAKRIDSATPSISKYVSLILGVVVVVIFASFLRLGMNNTSYCRGIKFDVSR